MEATKLTIQPATLANVRLTPKRRKELRRESILAYIRNKPYGERLQARELMQFGFNSNAGADHHLKILVRDGYITKHEIGLKSAFYTVNEPATTILPPRVLTFEDKPAPFVIAPNKTLEEQAMQFAWEHPLYNNDLREFIKWTTNKEGK